MKSPQEDIENRKPVWDAMQMLYMDIDPADELEYIAKTCAESDYSIDELENILFKEVFPACRFNLLMLPAPEWTGFDIEWLSNRIFQKHRHYKKMPLLILSGYTKECWEKLKVRIISVRIRIQERTMEIILNNGKWLNEPKSYHIAKDSVFITTEPETDFWQRSYYGFRNDNAPALLFESGENFTFTAKVNFKYKRIFDQCGLIIYINSENWFKASIEYQNTAFARLGSVVTNSGYSDWATNDIETPECIWYRLSRRGPDFLIESSFDGSEFRQMRIFHLHALGETTTEMGKSNPPLPATESVRFGVYACSPANSSFEAEFSGFKFEQCNWDAHSTE